MQQQSATEFEKAYQLLNTKQKQAVDTIEGPVMVVAGPGTGKTQILTLRIAKILAETQVDPENILALTFTTAGVRAMRDRLRSYIHDEAYRVSIFTFHSFAEHVLTQYRDYFPAYEFAQIITDVEKVQLLEEILDQHEFSALVSLYDRYRSLTQIMQTINHIKQEGISPVEFEAKLGPWEEALLSAPEMFYKRATGPHQVGDLKPTEQQKVARRVKRATELATVYTAYQRALQKRNRYDFSDMILTVRQALEENPVLKLDLQERYQYFLVDEHQDTNEGQNRLIELLTDAEHLNGQPNLFTVGDEKQSIYLFQGASDKAFSHFQSHYSAVQVITLTENYRSTKPILAAAHSLITKSLPTATALDSNQSQPVPVAIREFSDYKFELLFVAEAIEQKLKSGVPPEEIAVVYRSNKHLADIKQLFLQRGVPYQVLSRDTLLDDPAIMMLIYLFRVINNPTDDASLGKLLLAEFLGFDALEVTATLRAYAKATRTGTAAGHGLIDFLQSVDTYQPLRQLIADSKTFAANHPFSETFKRVVDTSGYLNWVLSRPDSRSALRKVEVLFNEIRKQSETHKTYQLKDFIDFVTATETYNLQIEVTAARVGTGVQCMTAHGAKGLEFEYVYLINTTQNNWEKSRGTTDLAIPIDRYQGSIDDERRLFYVAVTRAKRYLHISSARQDWTGRALEPSQFISELGDTATEFLSTNEFEREHECDLNVFLGVEKATDSIFDPEYLAQRFWAENLSVTALNNYLACPKKYLFRNLIKLPDVYTPALRYGNAVHDALEQFFLASVAAQAVLSRTELLQKFESAMAKAGFSEQDYQRFLNQGRQSLGMYYDYYHTGWTLKVRLEEYIRATLKVGEHELTLSGKIDKLEFLETQDGGPVRVVDYKTGKTFSEKSNKAQKLALERQIQFYHLLLSGYRDHTVTVTEAVLDFVEPAHTGNFEQKTLTVTEADLTALRDEIVAMADAIESGFFLQQSCQKRDCEYCRLWNALHE
jgi:DNA helicase-2/ATP-dependent DNA helicase PcrA